MHLHLLTRQRSIRLEWIAKADVLKITLRKSIFYQKMDLCTPEF